MATRYEMERQTALLAENAGEAINAMVRWGLAAQATNDELEQLEALVAARHQAELAFHQAVWSAVWARPKRHPWRRDRPTDRDAMADVLPALPPPVERLPRVSISVDEHESVGNVPRAGL